MAKIETYADATPTINDKLIGTDVSDNNETKNFSISDVLGISTDASYFIETTVDLSVAQIGALHTTPVTLVAAPGAGKYLSIDVFYQRSEFVASAWVTGAGDLQLKIGDLIAISSNFFEQTNSTDIAIAPIVQNNSLTALNTALTISATNAITGGDSPAKIYIRYRIIEF